MIVEAVQGDRVDLLVWSRLGREKGLVEVVIDLPENAGIADVMYDLPIGYKFTIPDWLIDQVQQVKQMKRLW